MYCSVLVQYLCGQYQVKSWLFRGEEAVTPLGRDLGPAVKEDGAHIGHDGTLTVATVQVHSSAAHCRGLGSETMCSVGIFHTHVAAAAYRQQSPVIS